MVEDVLVVTPSSRSVGLKKNSVAAILGPFHVTEWCMSAWELDS